MTSRKQASCSSVIYLKSLDHRHSQSHFDTQCVPGRPQKLEPTESSISFFPKKQRRDQNLSFSLEVSFSLFVVGIEVGFVFIPRATYRGCCVQCKPHSATRGSCPELSLQGDRSAHTASKSSTTDSPNFGKTNEILIKVGALLPSKFHSSLVYI